MREGPEYSVYVHVPWCRVRCPYCNFFVVPERGSVDFEGFVDAVGVDLESWRDVFAGAARSVYLGGGTPSRLPIPALGRLLASIPTVPGAERALEANPEDVTPEWLAGAVDAGVNRLSLGVQTMNARFARLLNRAHTVAQARDTMRLVRSAGLRSWSVDLIFALPDQTLEDLDADLEALLSEEPPHVSLYGLTYEPGTAFDRARERGRFVPIADELWRAMYDRIVLRLSRAGLHRYEVSNFAREGHRSDHNLGYWTDRPYLGVGPGAHGYAPDGRRWTVVSDVARWLADPRDGREVQLPSPRERAEDLLVSAIRCVEGLDLDRLRETGWELDGAIVARLQGAGLVRAAPPRLFLTEEGFPVSDAVVRSLAMCLTPAALG